MLRDMPATKLKDGLLPTCQEHGPRSFWPPSSPDANPLDYSIWSVIEAKACATPHPNLTELKASITREWAAMTDSYVVKTFKAFRPRIEAIIEAEGGHIEGKKR